MLPVDIIGQRQELAIHQSSFPTAIFNTGLLRCEGATMSMAGSRPMALGASGVSFAMKFQPKPEVRRQEESFFHRSHFPLVTLRMVDDFVQLNMDRDYCHGENRTIGKGCRSEARP